MTEEIELHCEDGVTLPATIWRAAPANTPRRVVVIAPALGVPRKFYRKFADALAQAGYGVLVFDYRGIDGAGAQVAPRDLQLAHWGQRDLQAALHYARTQLQADKLALVGHSIGGQLPGLASDAQYIDALVMVAASLPHGSRYGLRDRLQIELLWRVFVPLLGRGERFPARRIGFASIDLPGRIVREWAAWGSRKDYLFDPRFGLDTRAYARFKIPLLAYSFEDDGYASKTAVEALNARYSAAQLTHRHLARVPGKTFGHFGYFRESQRDSLWRETLDWLDRALR
ncbi:MAG TPA: alpha/beta fold hydrolase [Fontimonas sp.]